ncbi:MAG: 6-carboxytetrahydropterin synthase [Geminicoccaceae bacterium]|nr:6-carboxytetrahydropterin synthase [Geminicoccaceae bacterium]
MYFVRVRDHVMIAHSFKGDLFGPAQRLHGATFTVDVTFLRDDLPPPDNIVVDIGRALESLKATLDPLRYRNLDDLPAMKGHNTTTEYLARHVLDRLRDAVRAGDLGPGGDGLKRLRVEIGESHVAWAGYEGEI